MVAPKVYDTGTGVSSCVLVAGTGRDVLALSRPVPGFSNDHYGDVIHSFDWKSAVEHDGGV